MALVSSYQFHYANANEPITTYEYLAEINWKAKALILEKKIKEQRQPTHKLN
jgi:hypothetical protein